MRTKKIVNAAALLMLAGATASAFAAPIPTGSISVDGNLSDWGVVLLNNNASNIMPKTLAPGSSSQPCAAPLNPAWACEDSSDTAAGGGLVGPQYGGQDYDVEFLGAARGTGAQASMLYVGIASGLRPDNGPGLYGPGDLFLTVNGVKYVIEMGGGAGHAGGPALGAQTDGAAGSFYNLTASGNTASHVTLAGQSVGSIWMLADGTTTQTSWATQPTQWQKGVGAVSPGSASVYSTLDSLGATQSQHAVIEIGIDMTLFQLGSAPYSVDELRWGPSCFNDLLAVSGDMPGGPGDQQVPEPATWAMFLLGLFAFAALRRRRPLHGVLTIRR